MRLYNHVFPAIGRVLFAATILSSGITLHPVAATETDAPSKRSSVSSRETPTVLAIRRASPAVVNIHGQKTVRNTAAGMAGARGASSFKQVNGMGTGVVIDPRGYVVTNYHVVEDVADIRVTLHNGKSTTADLIATKQRSDLALIKVRTSEPLPTIPRGTSSDLMIGESVIAIGNAYGYVHTSTQGIISALHRDVPVNEVQEYIDLIQTSAGINPGNSGGPLLNIDGEMIGVNVAVRVGAQQIAFAIPIDQVIETVTEMINDHNAKRFAVGIRIEPSGDGALEVQSVSHNSVAASEGIKSGDRIVSVESRQINSKLNFALALLNSQVGDSVDMVVDRDGTEYDVTLPLGRKRTYVAAKKSSNSWDVIGIQTRPASSTSIIRLNAQAGTQYRGGLAITSVRPSSPAAAQGLRVGDILLGIHSWETSSSADLQAILEHPDVRRGTRTKFFIGRSEQTLYGHLQLASRTTSARR